MQENTPSKEKEMSQRFKYPKTPHLPFSEGTTNDDKILHSTTHLQGKVVVVTEKMDGENTTIYSDYCHARSLESKHKPYHSWLLSYISSFQSQIPKNWRICGEYLYAVHSIEYTSLPSYFMAFSVWNDKNECLSWNDTLFLLSSLGIEHVPVLYEGEYNDEKIKQIAKDAIKRGCEGIVVRLKDSFSYDEFPNSIAKYVRKGHIQTDKSWGSVIKKNSLK